MRISKHSVLSLTLGFLMLFSLLMGRVWINLKTTRTKPDLERLVSQHPPDWKMVGHQRIDDFSWGKSVFSQHDIVATRTYQHTDGRKVSVVMAWSGDGLNFQKIHEQQVCYKASGFEVSPLHIVSILTGTGSIDAMAFTAIQDARKDDVAYWMVIDGIRERDIDKRNPIVRQFLQLLYLPSFFRGELPDILMVRVSSVRLANGQPTTDHIDYIKEWLKTISSADRQRITGW